MRGRIIKVEKKGLLKILKTNRAGHRKMFLSAQRGFREKAITEIEKMLEQARDPNGAIRQHLSMIEPVDKTDDYDRVIGMLEMDVEKVVELNEQEFENFVRDRWDWSDHVTSSFMGYVDTGG